jgi:hypothetical protein
MIKLPAARTINMEAKKLPFFVMSEGDNVKTSTVLESKMA